MCSILFRFVWCGYIISSEWIHVIYSPTLLRAVIVLTPFNYFEQYRSNWPIAMQNKYRTKHLPYTLFRIYIVYCFRSTGIAQKCKRNVIFAHTHKLISMAGRWKLHIYLISPVFREGSCDCYGGQVWLWNPWHDKEVAFVNITLLPTRVDST